MQFEASKDSQFFGRNVHVVALTAAATTRLVSGFEAEDAGRLAHGFFTRAPLEYTPYIQRLKKVAGIYVAIGLLALFLGYRVKSSAVAPVEGEARRLTPIQDIFVVVCYALAFWLAALTVDILYLGVVACQRSQSLLESDSTDGQMQPLAPTAAATAVPMDGDAAIGTLPAANEPQPLAYYQRPRSGWANLLRCPLFIRLARVDPCTAPTAAYFESKAFALG